MGYFEFRPHETLYQYCSEEGLRGILKSKAIWFSNLKAANDPRELVLGYEGFSDALEVVRRENYPSSAGAFLSTLSSDLASHYETQGAYCACFSLARDELPMWRSYGSNNSGICIGFRPSAFLGTPGRMQKARYIDPDVQFGFKNVVLEAAAAISVPNASVVERIVAAADVLAFITTLKHKSWSYEREVRMIVMQPLERVESVPITDFRPDGTPVPWRIPLEREGRTGWISYLENQFGKYGNGTYVADRAIKEVIIGPNCILTISDVSKLMEANGFTDFAVMKSECQIR